MRKVTVEVCVGTHCTMMGAMNILELVDEMKKKYEDQGIMIETVKCFGDCKGTKNAPVVMINGEKITKATSEKVMAKVMEVINL